MIENLLNMGKKLRRKKLDSFESSHSIFFGTAEVNYAVFLDNRFPNGFEQVIHYFSSGFFQSDTTCVIFKYYASNYESIVSYCEAHNIQWFCFGANIFLPALNDMLVFYPFNSASNARLVENRSCYHILLMHGESNKVSSVKPLARLYDYILVAGDIACDRLIEHGILTSSDLVGGRVIKFGDTVLGDFAKIQPALTARKSTNTLAYFPTWEGGNDEENLCSLPYILPALAQAIEAKDFNRVILRLHPHTGERLSPYKAHIKELIATFLDAGIEVVYAVINRPSALEKLLMDQFPLIRWHVAEDDSLLEIDMAIVDVSALEAVLDSKDIPNFVCLIKEKVIAAPERYWALKGARHFALPGNSFPGEFVGAALDDISSYREALISYSDPTVKSMRQEDRLIWLNNYVRECNCFYRPKN